MTPDQQFADAIREKFPSLASAIGLDRKPQPIAVIEVPPLSEILAALARPKPRGMLQSRPAGFRDTAPSTVPGVARRENAPARGPMLPQRAALASGVATAADALMIHQQPRSLANRMAALLASKRGGALR
jgi:hypothetical protein